MITIDQLKDVKERVEALCRYLDIDNKKVQVEEEQLRTQVPGFWDDAKKAEAQMKKVKSLTNWSWLLTFTRTSLSVKRKWMKLMPRRLML